MILPGAAVVNRKIITNLRSPALQIQPCGIDLTLKRVLKWTSAGVIDFNNTHRRISTTDIIPFRRPVPVFSRLPLQAGVRIAKLPRVEGYIDLEMGSYLMEFNERVDVPLDTMGQIFGRSSLFRSGALVYAGVMDSGYKGVVGAVLQVVNPCGLRVWEKGRMAQMVFHEMTEKVVGYSGVYQGSEEV